MRQRIGWIALCVVVLVVIGRFVFAQVPTQRGGPPENPPLTASPTRISGQDLGFVVEGRSNGQVTGHFEVRINGNWVPVVSGMRTQPLTTR